MRVCSWHPQARDRFRAFLQSGALKVALVYLVIGLAWIFFSDNLAFAITGGSNAFLLFSELKGFGYIIVTTLMLYGLIRYFTGASEKQQQLLFRYETRYRKLYESMRDAFARVDMAGRIKEYNPAFREMLGYSDEELRGFTYRDITPERWHESEERILKEQVLLSGYSEVYEKEYRRKDGTIFPVELRTFLLRDDSGQPAGMGAIVRDITGRRRAEEALRESEKRLSLALSIARMGYWRYEVATGILQDYKEHWALFGLSGDGRTWTLEEVQPLVHPDDRADARTALRRTVDGGVPFDWTYRTVLPDGETRWLHSIGHLYRDASGKPDHVFGVTQDITESKRAEETLRESEEKYRLLYENSMDAILLTSTDGSIQAANPAACAMFKQTEEEIISGGRKSVLDLTDSRLSAALEERTRTGKFTGELTFVRKDGTKFAGEISTSIFTDRHRHIRTSMIIRDISERKKQAQALQIANQKLNLMNTVAWHDIYNKISGLQGYVELSREHITDRTAEEFRTREEEVLKVIQQQILYTREYQEIGQKPPRWHRLGSLLGIIRSTGLAGSIRITNEAENLEIYADPVIEKVFWHLIDNSVKHGKKVTEIRITARESASGCTLVYQDDGVGIPEDKKQYLFTKSFGKMTGFDLFFVHDILGIYGMEIDETGEPGKGVWFEIRIPRGQYRFTAE